MKKHLVITAIPEFAGTNAALKNLVEYLGKESLLFVLDGVESLTNMKVIDPGRTIPVTIVTNLHRIATFRKGKFIFNLKEFVLVFRSLLRIYFLCIRNGTSSVTIPCVRPEWYLYLLWLPGIMVHYIVHSEPLVSSDNTFTAFTCNNVLGKNKVITTVSHANKQAIIKMWGVSRENMNKIKVTYNCLSDKTEKSGLRKENSRKVVLTMGHVVEYKNPYFWLDVARNVTSRRNDVIFVWLGSGPLLKEFIEHTKDSKQISFPGMVQDPRTALSNSTIYYQPSRNETHGIAVLEAMANQVPCIVSSAGGLPESIVNNVNGLVLSYDDVGENADAILSLLDDRKLQQDFISASLDRFEALFTYSSFKLGMDKVYHKVHAFNDCK
jgi:glycosyltransferase involved in cell wall biosynthesis